MSEKATYDFYVAECMEFTKLGRVYSGIKNIEDAIEKYKEIKKSSGNRMGPGIGIKIQDNKDSLYNGGEIGIYFNGMVDDLSDYGTYFINLPGIRDDIEKLNALSIVTELKKAAKKL